jgi:hypothetical protein
MFESSWVIRGGRSASSTLNQKKNLKIKNILIKNIYLSFSIKILSQKTLISNPNSQTKSQGIGFMCHNNYTTGPDIEV